MTGYEINKKVLSLLGTNGGADYSGAFKNEAVRDIQNQILADLQCEEITDLSSQISLSKKGIEALVYGCCWLMAVAVRDKGCADLYAKLYSAKRAAMLSNTAARSDVLPAPRGGA